MIIYSTCRACHEILHVTDGATVHPGCDDKPTRFEQLEAQLFALVPSLDEPCDNEHELDRIIAEMRKLEDRPPRLLDAALRYASWGWPVFPIWEKGHKIGVSKTECRCGHTWKQHSQHRLDMIECDACDPASCEDFVGADILATGKTPATAHGFKDATTDAGRIRAWWERHPNANIGVPTGVRFDVIDIDLPDGPESFAQMLEDDLIPDVHGQVSTASCGRHLYIEPTGDGCTTRLQPGIDYRGVGGYVVVPPSTLGGTSWEWVSYPSPRIAGGES